jgi:hypothetical protein
MLKGERSVGERLPRPARPARGLKFHAGLGWGDRPAYCIEWLEGGEFRIHVDCGGLFCLLFLFQPADDDAGLGAGPAERLV